MFVLGFFHGNGPFISKSEPLWAGEWCRLLKGVLSSDFGKAGERVLVNDYLGQLLTGLSKCLSEHRAEPVRVIMSWSSSYIPAQEQCWGSTSTLGLTHLAPKTIRVGPGALCRVTESERDRNWRNWGAKHRWWHLGWQSSRWMEGKACMP